MNTVVEVGRLTADPEVRYSTGENSNAVCRFSVAVQRPYKNADGTYGADFPSCVAFGHNAEFISKFFNKGSMIAILGHLQTGSYTNKDGVKVYTTDVVVDRAEFAGSKNESGGAASNKPNPSSFVNVPDNSDDEDMPWGV